MFKFCPFIEGLKPYGIFIGTEENRIKAQQINLSKMQIVSSKNYKPCFFVQNCYIAQLGLWGVKFPQETECIFENIEIDILFLDYNVVLPNKITFKNAKIKTIVIAKENGVNIQYLLEKKLADILNILGNFSLEDVSTIDKFEQKFCTPDSFHLMEFIHYSLISVNNHNFFSLDCKLSSSNKKRLLFCDSFCSEQKNDKTVDETNKFRNGLFVEGVNQPSESLILSSLDFQNRVSFLIKDTKLKSLELQDVRFTENVEIIFENFEVESIVLDLTTVSLPKNIFLANCKIKEFVIDGKVYRNKAPDASLNPYQCLANQSLQNQEDRNQQEQGDDNKKEDKKIIFMLSTKNLTSDILDFGFVEVNKSNDLKDNTPGTIELGRSSEALNSNIKIT
jgi:hypothetical protein